MAESRRSLAAGLLLLAVGLLLLPWLLPSRFVLAVVWLAQPLLAAGWSLWQPVTARDGMRWLAVAVTWAAGYLALALALFWTLPLLLDHGSLQASLQVSGALGLVLIALWPTWERFTDRPTLDQSAEADSHAATDGAAEESATFSDLFPALLVLLMLSSGLALAWTGLLPAAWRLPAVAGHALLALLGHALIVRWGRPSIAPQQHRDARPATETAASHLLAGWPQAQFEPSLARAPAATVEPSAERRLYQLARAGQVELALQVLAEGADPNALPEPQDRDQRTLPMLAALLGDLRLLRALIGQGVDLNASHAGLTPLLAATRDSWHGRPEAVTMLLTNGADARQADLQGNTPLHHAARSTDPAVAALLLDAGADVGALNGEGHAPLGIACAAGNWRLAKYLLEHGAKAEPGQGQPALLAAAGGDDEPIGVQLLLKHKARVDSRGHQGRSALLQACQAGNVEIVGALLDAGADRNGIDQAGISPLLEASRHGHTAVVQRLALAKPDPDACDELGRNALCLACEAGGSADLIKHLVALGVDSEQRDASGRRALDYAIAGGRWPLVAVLDPGYPLPASMLEAGDGPIEKTPRALLRDALNSHRLESAEALARLGAWPDADGLAGLLLEFSNDQSDTRLGWLLRHGASPDARGDGDDSVLFQLFDRGAAARVAVRAALAAGAGVGGRGGLARYLAGCLPATGPAPSGNDPANQALALDLLARGADPFQGGDAPPLHLAVRLGWSQLLQRLLEIGVDPNCRDHRGRTALHVATAQGDEGSVQDLIRFGARPDLATAEGQTPLGIALATGRRDLALWLEWRRWPLPGRPLRSDDLPAAAMDGDTEAVTRLLALGLPVNGTDAQGCTALLRAAGGGHEATVAALLAASADPAVPARTGATPLSAAISRRHAGLVARLLSAGADPNQPLPGAITPLMLAAALGQPDLVEQLLAHGAQAQSIDEQGMGALHCAALFAFSSRDRLRALALLDAVLTAPLPVDQPTYAGHTPLLLLLGARADAGATCDEEVVLAVLERLLERHASVSAQDSRGWSPLHLAAMHGLSRVVQRLLRQGADRSMRDSLGRSPHDLAVLRGYVDVAAEFEPARGTPSLARFLREPPNRDTPSR